MTTPYFNKELSWLEFNARVLEEAISPETPLLERLKFLAIFTSNLDEFFMVRVAGLKKMAHEGLLLTDSPDGMETLQVLAEIRRRTLELQQKQYNCLSQIVLPGLEKFGIYLTKVKDLTADCQTEAFNYFVKEVSPVLTPLAFDPSHPFPFLTNQSLYLAVFSHHHSSKESNLPGLGFVEIPANLPRIIPLTSSKDHQIFILLEDLIAHHLDKLFIGVPVEAAFTIRVIRNLDYNLLENKVVDLLKTIQREMLNREHQEAVRIEVDRELSPELTRLLLQQLNAHESDLYQLPKPLFIPGLMKLYHTCQIEELKDPPFNPRLPPSLAGSDDIFAVIASGDLLVHHPYESFYAVTEFLHAAANDPNVLAIKQTLYRTAGDSPIIDALITAAENGKQVTAVVELKARFDEKNNIIWARRLERAGANVVFGFVGLKTHCKATLIVRKEKGVLQRYAHLSTGNYNSSTAKLYTDLGYFTANPDITEDIATLFNIITGFDVLTTTTRLKPEDIQPRLKKISMAPINLRQSILTLIDQEIAFHKEKNNGFIMAKMNALVDKEIIDALYKASQAGVMIKLIVRGVCCLRPGIPGTSENIEVISIVDRFLEHSRIYFFNAGGEQKVFLASADWMPRNMDRRIEICFPIEYPEAKNRLIHEILQIAWDDNTKARILHSNGHYELRTPKDQKKSIRSQSRFIEIAREGGVQSIPYDVAIRYNPAHKQGRRPIAKKKVKRTEKP